MRLGGVAFERVNINETFNFVSESEMTRFIHFRKTRQATRGTNGRNE